MKFADTPKITVAIRKRPLNRKEIQRSQSDIVRVSPGGQVTVSEHKQKVDLTKYLEETTFNFDYAFDETSSNEEIYEISIRPLIENAFKGAKISCFAYGQTGSGKTHTMKGDVNKGVPGLYYLGAREIFRLLQQSQFQHLHVTVSFYQIYCGRLYDLLNSRSQLKIREDAKQNINVIGLQERMICSANEFLDVIEYGSNFRVTSQNATNADSSRSHAILQISLKHDKKPYTKISFIDLAGNERGADHIDQNKQTKIDGAEINKSLLSLKECIRALDQGKGHTPFRGSKLTMVLKDSFVGFCNTVMICNVSPNSSSSENTMNTLRYADRVKELKSSQGQALTREQLLARELMLPRANNRNCVKVNIENDDDDEDLMAKIDEARQCNTQIVRNNFDEEKMDIEDPYENKRPFQQNGKRTDNMTNEMKLFNMVERRAQGLGQGSKQTRPAISSSTSQLNNFRGRGFDGDKQPLHSRNVRPNQVDQNNLNFVNSQEFEVTKRTINISNVNAPNNNMRRNTTNSMEVNRGQFEAMSRLKNDLIRYQMDHENLVTNEMVLINEEKMMKDQYHNSNRSYNSYQQEIGDVNAFLNDMEEGIRRKLEIAHQMKANLEKMRMAAQNASIQTMKFREDQEDNTHRHPHSHTFSNEPVQSLGQNSNSNVCRSQARLNGLHFNGFTNFQQHQPHQYGDEQLLEGLPGDETMTRLF